MRVLFLENDDSYSWNVVDLLRRCGALVRIESGHEHARIRAALPEAQAVVIGPGPLDPERAKLLEPVRAIIDSKKPLLGICLGHQAIGAAFGARLIRTEPAHGVRAIIRFEHSRFFSSLEDAASGEGSGETEVMRYHSLSLDSIASPLRCTARTRDGIAMAIEHESLPIAGLQFHPDSFATPRGLEMVASFLRAVR